MAISPASAGALPGPPLREPLAALDRALECGPGVDGRATPVLLVHGTWVGPHDNWSWGYRRVLPIAGHPTCTVRLPDRAFVDAQRSVEYVVHAMRRVAARAGRKISVISYSQGGLLSTLALRFWPDLASEIEDVVSLAAVHAGSSFFDALCQVPCFPAAQQMRPGSRLLAVYARRPLPSGPSYTSIFTQFDDIVFPQPQASTLPGARNVAVQDVCPGRPVEHLAVLGDAVAYALAVDALEHAGPVDQRRVSRAACLELEYRGANLSAVPEALAGFLAGVAAGETYPDRGREPALRCYLDPGCPKPRLRPLLRTSVTPVRDRSQPFTFTTRGWLELPEGALDPCRGAVTVRVKHGRRTVSRRRMPLDAACHFRSRVTFARSWRSRADAGGILRFLVRFEGTAQLIPVSSPTRRVRAG